jgi:type III secretion protein C
MKIYLPRLYAYAKCLIIAVMALGTVLTMTSKTEAAEIRFKNNNFSYLAQNKDLKEFIREFAASQGLVAVVPNDLSGTVNGKFNLTPQSMLDLLATNYGLIWYFDGNVLFVYPATEARSEIIRLNNSTVDKLRQALERLAIPDNRFPITYDARQNTALVSGPKRYVELVQQTARAVDQNEGARAATEVRLFPLKYAWAADFNVNQGGREFQLPGVATVLRNLYSPGGKQIANPPAARRPQSAVEKLRGLGLAKPGEFKSEDRSLDFADAGTPSLSAGNPDLPQFQADGRMNAVLVRDLPERMSFYEAVIKSLDVKPGLVEIEARVIEVSSDELESLGVDWRYRSSSGKTEIQTGRGNLTPGNLGFSSAQANGNATGVGVTPPVPAANLARGAIFSTVLRDAGSLLMARVSALTQQGKANILSSPKVMTLDNVEATVENLSTFFVRVAGNLDVDLFNVSSGTSLRVTPLIVDENGKRAVKMALKIEDGSLSDQQVDQIPVVQRSTISTQAFINEGESLLIAGYAQEVDRNTTVGVPGLSSIPLFGRLFRFDEKKRTRVERLFLLTPRVVPM